MDDNYCNKIPAYEHFLKCISSFSPAPKAISVLCMIDQLLFILPISATSLSLFRKIPGPTLYFFLVLVSLLIPFSVFPKQLYV